MQQERESATKAPESWAAIALSISPNSRTHRLLPLGYGLGNTSEDRAAFYVADQHGEVIHVMSAFSYGVWSLSDGYLSVQDACETAATLFGVHMSDALHHFADDLSAMVAGGAAILDLVNPTHPATA